MLKTLVYFLAVGALASSERQVHEVRAPLSSSGRLVKRTAVDKNAYIPVRIGLSQRNLENGYDHVMNVASPSSKNYARYWTAEEVEREFAPTEDAVREVTEWLAQSGIVGAQQTSHKGWIAFEAPVATVEQLLHAQLHEYEDRVDGSIRIGCDEYSLPKHIVPHVDYVTPGIELSPPMNKVKRNVRRAAPEKEKVPKPPHKPTYEGPYPLPPGAGQLPKNLQKCGISITPDCIRALYDIPEPGNLTIGAEALGIFENGDKYNQTELDKFFEKFAPYVPAGTHPHRYLINPPPEAFDDGESDIDFEMSFSLLGPVEINLYQTASPSNYSGPLELFNPFLWAVDASFCTAKQRQQGFQCGGDPLTTVVSASYGLPELFWQTRASQVRTCNEFMKYSLQGHTFVVSSGDYGVATNPGFGQTEFICTSNGCLSQNLTNPFEYTGTIFVPQFPAVCPYVLAVGGTQLLGNQTILDEESTMETSVVLVCGSLGTEFGSGGGFSNYFARPSYQNSTVAGYLANHVPDYKYYEANGADVSSNSTNIGKNGGIYNRPGRAYPDVSANGVNFTTFYDNEYQNFFGTSLAAPLWASIITMLNSERAAMGKKPVGMIQPVLYQNPQVFHDITKGQNQGCHTKGFPAVQGWDPSTGLGTPNFPALKKLFTSLP